MRREFRFVSLTTFMRWNRSRADGGWQTLPRRPLARTTRSLSTAEIRSPIRARPGNPMACAVRRAFSTTPCSPGAMAGGRPLRFPPPSSMSCTSGRPEGLPGWRFLGYLQTHDQVGNRARGERSGHLMSLDRVKIGAALVLCGPFIPMLFQGEEFAASTPFRYFTNHPDPDLARAVSEGRRQEFAAFGWPPQDVCDPQNPETFERSKLDWGEPTREPHATLLEWYRRLIALRRAIPALSDGRLDRVEVQFDEREQWLVLRRGPVAVVSNLAKARQVIPVPFPGVLLLSSKAGCLPDDHAFELPPDSIVILGDIRSGIEAGLGAGGS